MLCSRMACFEDTYLVSTERMADGQTMAIYECSHGHTAAQVGNEEPVALPDDYSNVFIAYEKAKANKIEFEKAFEAFVDSKYEESNEPDMTVAVHAEDDGEL